LRRSRFPDHLQVRLNGRPHLSLVAVIAAFTQPAPGNGHDVHDVNIAIIIQIEMGRVAPVAALAAPAAGHAHDVHRVDVAVTIGIVARAPGGRRYQVNLPAVAVLAPGDNRRGSDGNSVQCDRTGDSRPAVDGEAQLISRRGAFVSGRGAVVSVAGHESVLALCMHGELGALRPLRIVDCDDGIHWQRLAVVAAIEAVDVDPIEGRDDARAAGRAQGRQPQQGGKAQPVQETA